MQELSLKIKHFKLNRLDTLILIIFNFFIVFLIASKDMSWSFHPFKNDFIADVIGLQYDNPNILPKFGFMFRFLTILCNLCGVVSICITKSKYREYLIPVLIWNVYTITSILANFCHILISIISLQIPFKAVLSISIAGVFVSALYFKLIFQLFNFYEHLQFIQ